MNKLSVFASKHPTIIAILIITLLVFGGFSFTNMTSSLMSDINLPQIMIFTIYPGASPEDIEKDITKVIEDDMSTLSGIKDITSSSGGSISSITLFFNDSVNPEDKIEEVRYRIRQLKDDLPDSLNAEPYAFIADSNMLPIITFSAENEDGEKTYDYLNDVVVPKITKIKGVSDVSVIPDLSGNIKVVIDTDRLSLTNISLIDVYKVLSSSSYNIPLEEGEFKRQGTSIRFEGSYTSIEDIEQLPVGITEDNVIIRLKDIADIKKESKDSRSDILVNGKEAFIVSVSKRSDGDVIKINKQVKKIIKEIEKETHGAVVCNVLSDDSDTTKTSIKSVATSGVLGIIMAVLAIYLCIGEGRATFIIGVSIPLCLVFSFILLSITGRTINVMTLSGLVVALGMIVDGSIVMLEEIYRYIKSNNYSVLESIKRGSSDVASSIFASVLTTVVVFVPIMLLPGVVGKILSDVALTLIFSMTASFIMAVVVVPFLITVLCKNRIKFREHKIVDKMFSCSENVYKKILAFSLKKKNLVITLSIVIFLLSLVLILKLGLTFLPSVDQNNFYVNVQLPYTYTEDDTRREEQIIREYLLSQKEIKNVTSTITRGSGKYDQSGRNLVYFHANLVNTRKRKKSVQELIPIYQDKIQSLSPDANIKVQNGGFDTLLGYVSDGGGWGITLTGGDLKLMYDKAEKIKEELLKHEDVMSASISTTYDNNSVIIKLNNTSTRDTGVNATEAALSMALLFRENSVGKFTSQTDNKRYDIMLTSDLAGKRVSQETLSKLNVRSINGDKINLDTISSLDGEKSLTFINRSDRARTVSIKAILSTSDTQKVSSYMREYLKNNPLPEGVSTESGGIITLIEDSAFPIARALIIAVFLVYVVMVVQFQRFTQPFIIMICVPFTLIGIVVGLLLFNTPFSIMSVLSLVALSGTVVNNGIILIDYINITRNKKRECKEKGIDFSQTFKAGSDITGADYGSLSDDYNWELDTLYSTVVSASSTRIKPIFMTVATTMLGVIPMAFSRSEGAELYSPLGQSMMFGLLTSTVVSLLLVPTLYFIIEKRRIIKKKLKSQNNS